MNPPVDRLSHLRAAMEQIALDSMGVLSAGPDHDWVREHLADGCPECGEAARRVAEVFDSLLLTAQPVSPPPRVRAAVLAAIRRTAPETRLPRDSSIQVWNRWSASAPEFYTLPAADTEWQDTAIPGVQARMLHVDEERDQVTMLVRMAAGTAYPGHRHGGDEQCYVLQGDLQVEGRELRAGDYQFAPKGSIHGVQSTRCGCTLLLVSSRHDELLAG